MSELVKTESGIETMNIHNAISKQTTLFGLIAESAQTNRLFVILNRMIKANNANAMIIPMNIREDDFYFTVSNMKKSHVNGSFIAKEYEASTMDLLDKSDDVVKVAGVCDFVLRVNETLEGSYIYAEAIKAYAEDNKALKIAIIGSNALAKALALVLKDKELFYFHPQVETLMPLVEINGAIDINRVDSDMPCDLSGFDMLITTEDLSLESSVQNTPTLSFNSDNDQELLEYMSSIIFDKYIKG